MKNCPKESVKRTLIIGNLSTKGIDIVKRKGY
jgi:hypothetical protein